MSELYTRSDGQLVVTWNDPVFHNMYQMFVYFEEDGSWTFETYDRGLNVLYDSGEFSKERN